MAGNPIPPPAILRRMAEQAKPRRHGGTGRRNPDSTKYQVKRFHHLAKPPPPDFREMFLEHGYELNWIYTCRWPVFRRWIDECGGEELLAARKEWLRKHGRAIGANARHVKGWTAEKLAALHGG